MDCCEKTPAVTLNISSPASAFGRQLFISYSCIQGHSSLILWKNNFSLSSGRSPESCWGKDKKKKELKEEEIRVKKKKAKEKL